LDLISQERGNADSYYLVDGLGSTRGLTNASGVVTDTYAYDAFGNLIASTANIENDYLFAGEQFDGDLGQYYLRDRYYNPSVGRFTRVDSYEGRRRDPMSLHDYLYAHANPVNFIDPSGLFAMQLNSTMATMGALAAIAWVSWVVPTLKFATAISLAAFLASYGIYLAMSSSEDGNETNEEEEEIENLEEQARRARDKKKQGSQEQGSRKPTKGANKRDKDQIDRIAKEKGMSKSQREKFGDYVEKSKKQVGRGGNKNYTEDELQDLADDFLN
jgi:RHS repeat-associated protein